MAKLGSIYVSVRARTDKYKRDLAKAKTLTQKNAVWMQHQINKINFKAVGASALVFGATVALGMKQAIDAASNLEETVGKFDVVFADHGQQAEEMAKILVDSYAMSTREAKQYLSSIQDLLVPMGMASDAAIIMSNEVVKLSADLASFNNVPTATAMADIQSALVGNFETMKKYGVVLNETVIKQEALNQGLWNGKGMVDANTKAYIAFNLMLKGSAAAIGDQQRTMGSYANQMKQLMANVEDLQAMIGNELLPEITKIIQETNDWIKANDGLIQQKTAESIDEIKNSIGDLISIYDKMPAGVVGPAGYGIVGAILFGGKAGRIIFIITLLNEQLSFLGMSLGDLAEKHKKFVQLLTQPVESFFGGKNSLMGEVHFEKVKARLNELARLAQGFSYFIPDLPKPITPDSQDVIKLPKIAKPEKVDKAYQNMIDKLFEPILKDEFERDQEMFKQMEEAEEKRLEIVKDFNTKYAELGLDRFELERLQIERLAEIWKEAGIEKNRIEKMVSDRSIQISKAEQIAKLDIYQSIAGGIANTFQMIAQAGGKQSKAAFLAYKAFAIVEATIAGHKAYSLALADPTVPSSMLRNINAGLALTSAMLQVGMIASAQPPSYDQGGISNAKGIYQTGNIAEAHIPIPSGGKIPVEVKEKEKEETKPQEINIFNSIDPSVMDAWAASSRGQNAIFNSIGSQPQRLKRLGR